MSRHCTSKKRDDRPSTSRQSPSWLRLVFEKSGRWPPLKPWHVHHSIDDSEDERFTFVSDMKTGQIGSARGTARNDTPRRRLVACCQLALSQHAQRELLLRQTATASAGTPDHQPPKSAPCWLTGFYRLRLRAASIRRPSSSRRVPRFTRPPSLAPGIDRAVPTTSSLRARTQSLCHPEKWPRRGGSGPWNP